MFQRGESVPRSGRREVRGAQPPFVARRVASAHRAQLAVESLLLGLAGSLAGLLVGRAGVHLLASFTLPGGISLAEIPFDLNGRVLVATMTLGALTALLFGLWPAMQTSKTSLIASLRNTQAKSGLDTRAVLLGCEVALSIVLLVGAGLFVRTVQAGLRSDLGFDPSPLAAVRVNPALGGYKGADVASYYQLATAGASQIPGVTGVALSTHVPLARASPLPFVSADKAGAGEGSANDQVNAGWVYISPNYFDVLRVPIVDGRAFIPDDTARAFSTAIINQAAAKALFPDGHPVGRQMVHAGSMRFTVVGVVRDTKYASVQDRHVPMVFTPMTPDFSDDVHFIVRSSRPQMALEQVRDILTSVAPHPPIREPRLVAEQINAVLEPQRFGAAMNEPTRRGVVGLIMVAAAWTAWPKTSEDRLFCASTVCRPRSTLRQSPVRSGAHEVDRHPRRMARRLDGRHDR
ncbi:MAG TPA: ABC transporter permease [Gemmatimonadaceae bacterium]|nr:ABC transporter permease [Gemmatimonadaceae bacterium]